MPPVGLQSQPSWSYALQKHFLETPNKIRHPQCILLSALNISNSGASHEFEEAPSWWNRLEKTCYYFLSVLEASRLELSLPQPPLPLQEFVSLQAVGFSASLFANRGPARLNEVEEEKGERLTYRYAPRKDST